MKHVRATARLKRRYLLIENASKEEIEEALLFGLGTIGWAEAQPFFIEISANKGHTVLAVERTELQRVRAALFLSPRKIRVLRVSGTIKGLKV